MSQLVQYEVRDKIAIVTVNNPPVNALSANVSGGIGEAIRQACADGSAKGVVLIGGGKTFIAGADIRDLSRLATGEKANLRSLHELLNEIENTPKPIICAIHGTALGGGFELAMACHSRIAVPTARVGQPEVKLGIIPGASGTQRLPRLIGIASAAEICATGRMVKAAEALQLGMIDQIVEGDLLEGAMALARKLAEDGQTPRKTRELNDKLHFSENDKEALDALKARVMKRARGIEAPLKAIELVEKAATMSFEEGCQREREIFMECLRSDAARGLIHIFFSERATNKVPGISTGSSIGEIRRAAVIGGGTMGCGIAMCYANAGIPVVLKEVDQQRLEHSMGVIRKNYTGTVQKGKLSEEHAGKRLALISQTLDYADIKEADIVVEAVFENLELKKKVFGEIDAVAKEDAILATNTSTLDIDQIAAVTRRPDRVIGHHFFSPANVMKLLEIVRGQATSDDIIVTSMALSKKLRKVGVLAGNCFGFIANRMFLPYVQEAQFLVEEGAKVDQVDRTLFNFGMAMGPLAVSDLAGNDITWRIKEEIKDRIPDGMRQPLMTDILYENGRYGQKTGKGWYQYEPGRRKPNPDPEVEQMVEETAARAGITRREIATEEIIERTVFALINEGAKILEEGIALRPGDIDVIYIYGYGFPAHRGGPMFYADTIGLKTVLNRVQQLKKQQGFWWKPAPLLKELAEAGKTFVEWERERN